MKRVVLLCALLSAPLALALPGQGGIPPRPPPGWCPAPGKVKLVCFALCGYTCEWPPHPAVQTGQLTPSIYPVAVMYAVPGRSSSMAYSQGDKVGSSTSIGSSWKNGINVEFDAKEHVLFTYGQVNFQFGQDWGSSAKGTVDVTVEHASGYRKLGEVDDVDHGDDEVWFLMDPTIELEITPESVYGARSVKWSFSATAPGTLYFLYAGEISGARPIPAGVQQTLDRYGVSASDVAELANADPFITTPGSNPAGDPVRFDLLWTGPYRPVAGAGDQPNPQSYAVSRKLANTIDQSSEVTVSTSVKIGAGLDFIGLTKASLSFQDKFSFTQSTAKKNSLETNSANTITVGQPAFGYLGPTVLRVYEDKVFKTYVFHLDWM